MKSPEKVVAIKPAAVVVTPAKEVEKKVVAEVKVAVAKKKEVEPQNNNGNIFGGYGGGFGGNVRPGRDVVNPKPGEPAKFTGSHRNWRASPSVANETVKVLSKTGKAITDKEFKLLAGAVAINGFLLEPVVTDLQILDVQTLSTNKHGLHIPADVYPHSLYTARTAFKPVSAYQFELNGENVVILLDADSSYWFDGDTFYHQSGNHMRFATARHSEEVNTKGGAVALLENSHLKNCNLIGAVCILNGDFTSFELNNSRYQHSKDIHPRHAFARSMTDLAEEVTKHPVCRGGSLINTRVTNSKLGSGYYQNCHIHDSTLEFGENNYSSVVRTTITDANIKAKGQVMIVDGSLQGTTFQGNQFCMAGFTLDAISLYIDSVYAPSKVCVSRFDAIDSNYTGFSMVRLNGNSINLYRNSSSQGNLVFKISEDDDVLRETIKDWVISSGYRSRHWSEQEESSNKQGVIGKSIARYTVDTVMARLKSIRLLDEVRLLSRDTGNCSGYDLSDLVNY